MRLLSRTSKVLLLVLMLTVAKARSAEVQLLQEEGEEEGDEEGEEEGEEGEEGEECEEGEDCEEPVEVFAISDIVAGVGYNIFKGNPRPLSGDTDQGWMNPVIKVDYDDSRVVQIGGKAVVVPNNFDIRSCKNCELSFHSSDAMDAHEFKENLRGSVSANFEGFGGSFTASASYNEVQESFEESNTRIIESTAICSTYCVSVDDNALSTFTDGFEARIRNLPVEYDLPLYTEILENYGTHYCKRATLGARAGTQITITQSSLTALGLTDMELSVAASYSGWGVEVEGEASVSKAAENSQALNEASQNMEQFKFGGEFAPDKPTDEAANEWYEAATTNGLPLSFELDIITALLTPEGFPDDPYIDRKRANLVSALVQYCSELQRTGVKVKCHDNDYKVSISEPHGGNVSDERIVRTRFSDLGRWAELGQPMMSSVEFNFYDDPVPDEEVGFLVAIRPYYEYIRPGYVPYEGQTYGSARSLPITTHTLQLVDGARREYITSAEVCTVKKRGRSGVPSNVIFSLKFGISGRPHPEVFVGENTDTFYYIAEPLTMSRASERCVALGGSLVQIFDGAFEKTMVEYVASMVSEGDYNAESNTELQFWIGFNSRAAENEWVWTRGDASSWTDSSSAKQAMRDKAGEDERCAAFGAELGYTDANYASEGDRVRRYRPKRCAEKFPSVCYAPYVGDCKTYEFTSRLGLLAFAGTVAHTAIESLSFVSFNEELLPESQLRAEYIRDFESGLDDGDGIARIAGLEVWKFALIMSFSIAICLGGTAGLVYLAMKNPWVRLRLQMRPDQVGSQA